MKTSRARYFKSLRENHLSEKAEDYTELISDLSEREALVRVCDIAREMGISHVSVLKAMRRLSRDGYLTRSREKGILLTPKGKKTASFSKKRHEILSEFFVKLGVSREIAAADVEGIEHHISKAALEAIEAHMHRFNSLSDSGT